MDSEVVIGSPEVVVDDQSDTKKEEQSAEGGQKCGHRMYYLIRINQSR